MAPTRIDSPNLLILTLLLVLSLAGPPASGQEFGNLEVPRTNRVYQPVLLPNPARASLPPLPPRSHALEVRVLRNGQVLHGSHSIDGNIVGISGNVIAFDPENGPRITIGYALPGAMMLKGRKSVLGHLTLNDVGSPFAADQQIVVSADSTPYSFFIWQSRRNPITFALPGGVGGIRQQPDGDALVLSVNGTSTVMRSGHSATFTAWKERYTLYVQTVMRQSQGWTRVGDGAPSTYVLKAIVCAVR